MSEEERQYSVNVPNIYTARRTKARYHLTSSRQFGTVISRTTTTEQVLLTIGVVEVCPPLFIPADMVGSEMEYPEELASSPKATQA